MARLGSVVGGILAELTRARVVADTLTRDLAAEYADDPLLSSLAVPRLTLGEANLTIRFTVADLQEAEVQPVDPKTVSDGWKRELAENVLPNVLARRQLTEGERAVVLSALESDRPAAPPAAAEPAELVAAPARAVSARFRVADVRKAIGGERATLAESSTNQVLDRWNSIPSELRTKLGGKSEFASQLAATTNTALASFLDRQAALAQVQAALRSTVDVSVKTADLPADPEKVQELHLVLRGDDLDTVVSGGEVA
jgi:hypothetical protein